MALLYISEYAEEGHFPSSVSVGAEPSTDQTPVTLTGSSAQSSAFKNNTRLVRLANDSSSAICVAFGTNPTATVSVSKRMAANQTEYFAVPLGLAYKVAAINVAL